MALGSAQASIEQPDVAVLETGGVYFRCYVYVDRNSQTLEFAIYTEQEYGQDVLLAVGPVTDVVTDNTPGLVGPKVIPHGTKFVVVMFDPGGPSLKKLWLDMATIHTTTTWTNAGTITVHADALFDIYSIDASVHVVAWKEASSNIKVSRFDGTDWTAAWTTIVPETPNVCLGVYGSVADNIVIVSYEITPDNTLYSARMLASDGTGDVSAPTFTASPQSAANFSRVGHARISSTVTAVVAEFRPTSFAGTVNGDRLRGVCYRKINNSDATQIENEHYCYNINLQSRPFTYASHKADGSAPDLYAYVGFKTTGRGMSQGDIHEWAQSNYYVANFDQSDWGKTAGTIRPRQVATMNLGTADARNGFLDSTGEVWKSRNHLSNIVAGFSGGPFHKGRTAALSVWSRLVVTNSGSTFGIEKMERTELVPAGAAVRGYTFFPEDPWQPFRDPKDPPEPLRNYKVPYPWRTCQHVEVGHFLALSGGTPAVYDGRQITEIGFAWWPEILGRTTPAGNIPNGDYYYTAVYEWRDSRGQLHRSAPSRPLRQTITGGPDKVTVSVRTIPFTSKTSPAYPGSPAIDIVLYRTKASGTVFYRVYGYPGVSWSAGGYEDEGKNDTTAAWVDIDDDRTDAELQYNEPLPFSLDAAGNWTPFENFQPPASTAIALWQNRVFLASAEDGRQLWYSAEVAPEGGGERYETPRFNPANVYRLDDGGDTVAIAPMDDGLVVLKRDSTYVVHGQGNTDAGTGATYAHQVVLVGTGCIEPKSVVSVPGVGLFFQSDKGYYLLTRTLEGEYIGAPIEDNIRLAGNVRAATSIEDRHQIRIVANQLFSSGYRVYIYDYLFRQWSETALPSIVSSADLATLVDGCSWAGASGERLHVTLAAGGLFVERPKADATPYKDTSHSGDEAIIMEIQTRWIHLAGIAGYKRVRRILVQLERVNSGAMQAILDYSYDGGFSTADQEILNWSPTAPGLLVIKPRVQKMSSFRIYLSEVTPSQVEGTKILSLTIEYAVKKGTLRVPDANAGVP